jgi:hypothetical protein
MRHYPTWHASRSCAWSRSGNPCESHRIGLALPRRIEVTFRSHPALRIDRSGAEASAPVMARKFDVGRAALSANCTADLTWVKQDLLGGASVRVATIGSVSVVASALL